MAKNGLDKKGPETIDGETGRPVNTPRTINLSKLRDVRLEMAFLYRQVDAGTMDSTEANKRVWHLRNIGEMIELAEFERRIAELEERQAGMLPSMRALPALRSMN